MSAVGIPVSIRAVVEAKVKAVDRQTFPVRLQLDQSTGGFEEIGNKVNKQNN
jgi:hypothetical protein